MARKHVMTIGELHLARCVKVYRDSEWNEYVARLYLDGKLYPPADCFDDNKESMLATAQAMYSQA